MLNLNESCACGWTLDKEISGWFTLLGNHQGLLFAQSSLLETCERKDSGCI